VVVVDADVVVAVLVSVDGVVVWASAGVASASANNSDSFFI
jgi:hypothetical protein